MCIFSTALLDLLHDNKMIIQRKCLTTEGGGQHSTDVAFVLHVQWPQGRITAPEFFNAVAELIDFKDSAKKLKS